MTDTKDLVFVSKDEYIALVSKAAIYDAFARKLKADTDRGGYVSEYEQAMFVVDEPTIIVSLGLSCDDDEPEEDEFDEIPAEEWEKIEAKAEEVKEEENAETV